MDRNPIISAVIVPALQAIFTGFFCGLASGTIALLAGYPKFFTLALVVGTLAMVLTWLTASDRAIPKPEKPKPDNYQAVTVRVDLLQEDSKAGWFLDIPLDRERLTLVCRSLQGGCDFSLASLGGAGKPLTRSEFEILRDYFITRGLARWINPHAHNAGCSLSAAGRAIVRRFAE